jgi:hypothetical protein
MSALYETSIGEAMTIKLIYVCDRCSVTSEDGIGWSLLWPIGGSLDTESGIVAGFSKAYLCPACSERALEKPEPDPFHCAKCGERFADGFEGVCCSGGKNYHFPSCQ